MARKPSLTDTEREARATELLNAGASIDVASARSGVPREAVRGIRKRLAADKPAFKLEAPPSVPVGATPLDRAELQANWLKSQIDRAVANDAPMKDTAALSAQYGAAIRLVAQLSGAFEVTAHQIIKSVDFARALQALKRALGDNKEVWARWELELATLLGER